jgi:hypothetical protein
MANTPPRYPVNGTIGENVNLLLCCLAILGGTLSAACFLWLLFLPVIPQGWFLNIIAFLIRFEI